MLVSIDTVASGSAGGSLHQANAVVCLIKIAMIDSGKAEDAVKTYLNGMNATQKDFFSFQWQQALRHTNALLDGSEDPAILDMGSHEVGYYEAIAVSSFKKFEIYYPSDIEKMDTALPVVVFVNGTSVLGSKYPALQMKIRALA